MRYRVEGSEWVVCWSRSSGEFLSLVSEGVNEFVRMLISWLFCLIFA